MDDADRWIWPFELLEKIGEGGMGVVYRARYVVNDRLLAVKLIPSDVTDETILARFERELEILKTLKHPHVVRCFGGACENKRRFYAMELVEGGSLEDLLREEHRLQWRQVADLGQQMCAALAFLHENDVVHRDVKPGNFLMTKDGKLKLSDFGLATVAAARKITQAGRTMGTYHYMAPEQIRGKDISPRTDLYAMGCVFYEMLTGRTVYSGQAAAEILQNHLNAPIPKVTAFVDCPPQMAKLIEDLLQKSQADRPQTAVEVARRLKSIATDVIVEPSRRQSVSGVSQRPVELSETRTVATPKTEANLPRSVPAWVVPVVTLLVAALLIGNLSQISARGPAQDAEVLWIDAFQQDNIPVQTAAATALGRLAPSSERAAGVLQESLKDLDQQPPEIRMAIADAIGEAGGVLRESAAKLALLQKSEPEPLVRRRYAAAIQRLERSSEAGRSWATWLIWLIVVAALGFIGWDNWRRRTSR